jgi:hypothetical protein
VHIKSEYDIQFHLLQPTPMVAMLHVHPSTEPLLVSNDRLKVEHIGPANDSGAESARELPLEEYLDGFGNRCSRFVAPAGAIRLSGGNTVNVTDQPELQGFGARQVPVEQLPHDVLQFLLASRYCEVDKFGGIAQDLFGHLGNGWALAATIRDWVHEKVAFNYKMARATKTAMDVYTERVGVCRDYQHLAITLSPLHEPACALRHRLHRRHPRALLRAGRLQRLVPGMAGGPLVGPGRAPQLPAHRPHPDGHRP